MEAGALGQFRQLHETGSRHFHSKKSNIKFAFQGRRWTPHAQGSPVGETNPGIRSERQPLEGILLPILNSPKKFSFR